MSIEQKDLQERRVLIAAEGEKIDKAIADAQAASAAENQKIQELVGLKNINSGLLADIDHWIEKLAPRTGEATKEEKPA